MGHVLYNAGVNPMYSSRLRRIFLAAGMLLILNLQACSSHIPTQISQPVINEPSLDSVRLNLTEFIGQKVRWGGTILATENGQNTSLVSIVAFPLNAQGRPVQSGESMGRFIASIDDFLEPLVYSADRQITVTGSILRTEPRKVGDYTYNYPVIKVDNYYLWEPVIVPEYNYPPYWWYDPWYYPPGYPYHIHRPR